jgi:rsbT antagonist protein RsbS
VTALDVIDSFLARSIRAIAVAARLRGASTVVVGIRPDVAIALVQFDLNLEPLVAALDLDEAIALLDKTAAAQGDLDVR